MENIAVSGMLPAIFLIIVAIIVLIKGDLRLLKSDPRKNSGLVLIIFFVVFVIFAMMFSSLDEAAEQQEQESYDVSEGVLRVHYIDVGQGDATLFQGQDFTVLIDAGRHDRYDLVSYLKEAGILKIDLLIGTHPHSDHIGQMEEVLKFFPVDEVWMSGGITNSRTFERAVDAITESEAGYHEPRAGENFQIKDLFIKVIHPKFLTGDLNDDSLSIHVRYNDIAFVFTGDVEKEGERKIVNRDYDIKAHILQAGHHGSSTSNTPIFLDAVEPEVVIYSAEKENPYGYPHSEILEILSKRNIKTYGTDIYGTILVITDGENYSISTSKGGAE